MNYKNTIISLAAGPLLLGSALTANAGGPLAVCEPGVPFLWPDGGANIPFNPDQGNLGVLDNAAATEAVVGAFQVFEDVASSTASYTNAGPIPGDVDDTNFFPFLFPAGADGLSPIVFDDDGAIFTLLFGDDSGVLGFAGPDILDSEECTIVEGLAFLNGPAIDTLEGLVNVMVHEFGHYTNLAHTVVNGQIFIGDTTGPTPDDTFGAPPSPVSNDVIETMYPFLFSGIDQLSRTLEPDDIAILSTLYPEPNFLAGTGTISGTISILGRELSGVNVIARNVDDPFFDAVSAISGDFTQGAPETGTYTINNLTPGATYAVYVDIILAGGFSTPPRLAPPGAEEFHNSAGTESGNDDPLQFDGVTVAAGAPSTGIDVIFNPFAANAPLPLADNGAVEIFLPFEFPMCGQSFDSVFVNTNGNVTFGQPDFQNVENIAEFLGGPPRIAGLWRDLDTFNGNRSIPQGTVSYMGNDRRFTVNWSNLPEAGGGGSNSLAVRLINRAGIFEIESANLSATNGIVGMSCGGGATSQFEQESDLSAFASRPCGPDTICLPPRLPAVFELFDASDHDLDDTRLRGASIQLDDRFEPNDSLEAAVSIGLPFNTMADSRFTEIRPAGGDVDYYDLGILSDETVIAEVLTGRIDSIIGVFSEDGELVAVDDDGGNGLLSRVAFVVPTEGRYFIAVSTFPDFDFSGAGNNDPIFGVGRYVLDVQAF